MNKNDEFVNRNYNLIKFIVDRRAGRWSAWDREDLVNNIVVACLETEAEIKQKNASAYINEVCKNIMIDIIRHSKVDAMGYADSIDQPLHVEEDDVYSLHDKMATVAEDVCTCGHPDMHYFMQPLTGIERQIWQLKYCHGLGRSEICEALVLKNSQYRTHIRSARDKINELLEACE